MTHRESQEVLCRFDLDRSGILTLNVTDVGSARNLVRRIAQAQDVRSADLSDLTAVRLSAPLNVAAHVTPDDYGDQRPDDRTAFVKTIDATADSQAATPELADLRQRALAILARTTVDPLDGDELRDHLTAAENDASSMTRQVLADLVCFLEKDMELPELWTCAVCRARHPAPERQGRRCGADLLALAAVHLAAIALTYAGQSGGAALIGKR